MRIHNSIKNVKYNFAAQFISILVQFVSRTIFIQILGKEYLGVNGLFTNLLTILSLADMGMGTVISYTMYKPLAKKDYTKLCQLINTYQKIYLGIAFTILGIGLCLTPFLRFLIRDIPNIPNLSLIYILYLLNTVVSYLFVYKISVINADQKNYIVTVNQQLFTIIAQLIMTIVLLLTHNFIFYLIVQIVFTVLSNLRLSHIADKLYPFAHNCKNYNLPNTEKRQIQHSALAMVLHKLGGVVVSGTDNLLMSIMVGVNAVGVYSNYLLIIGAVKKVISMYSTSVIASVGNLTVAENTKKMQLVYNRLFYSNFVITTFCSACLLCLLNPFIQLWLSEDYVFSILITGAIVTTFHIDSMRQTTLTFIDAMGLFTKNKLKPVIESICNLVLSIILTWKFGVIGIILGTALSQLFVCTFWEIHTLYKYGFKQSIKKFLPTYLAYLICSSITIGIVYSINTLIPGTSLASFMAKTIIAPLLSTFLIFIFTFRTPSFIYFKKLIINRIFKDKE